MNTGLIYCSCGNLPTFGETGSLANRLTLHCQCGKEGGCIGSKGASVKYWNSDRIEELKGINDAVYDLPDGFIFARLNIREIWMGGSRETQDVYVGIKSNWVPNDSHSDWMTGDSNNIQILKLFEDAPILDVSHHRNSLFGYLPGKGNGTMFNGNVDVNLTTPRASDWKDLQVYLELTSWQLGEGDYTYD